MQYEFSSTDKEKFSLHDCRSTYVERINERLIFRIPDGFFNSDYSDDWPNTGNAEVEFKMFAFIYLQTQTDRQSAKNIRWSSWLKR